MFKFLLECEGKLLDAIIDDEGELQLPGHDIDADIIAVELGDDPSECLLLKQGWDAFIYILSDTGSYGDFLRAVTYEEKPFVESERPDDKYYEMSYKNLIRYLVESLEESIHREIWGKEVHSLLEEGYSLGIARIIGALPDSEYIDIKLSIEPEIEVGYFASMPLQNIEHHELSINGVVIAQWMRGVEWVTDDVIGLTWGSNDMKYSSSGEYDLPFKGFDKVLEQFGLEDPVPDFPPRPYTPKKSNKGRFGIEFNGFDATTMVGTVGRTLNLLIWYKNPNDAFYHYKIVKKLANEDFYDHSEGELMLIQRDSPDDPSYQRIALAGDLKHEANEELRKWLSSR